MEIINPQIQEYAEKHSSQEGLLLEEIAIYTKAHHPEFKMLSGHLQGKFLSTISSLLQPRRILEIGTMTGYSAICLAAGLPADGELHTIEKRESDAHIAQGFINKSAIGHKIIVHVGDAKTIIPQLKEEWDLVFLDADKIGYIEYFNLVFPKIRKNGCLLADNVFFHGLVLDSDTNIKSAKAIKEFNEFIKNRVDIETTMLTIRDGLSIIRKL